MKVAVRWEVTEEFEKVIEVPDGTDVDAFMDGGFTVDDLAEFEGNDSCTYVGTPERNIVDWEIHEE